MRKIKDRAGEIGYNKQGLKMKIIEYFDCFNLTILFDDGFIVKNRNYQEFKNGAIYNKNFPTSNTKSKLGEKNINSQGCEMEIVRYFNNKNIDILFDDGTLLKNTTSKHFKDGSIRNPNFKSVYGVGYLGIGEHSGTDNLKIYNSWSGMLERCYNKKCKQMHPTYIDCVADERFHNFQYFYNWYIENNWSNSDLSLDKDILVKGNKIYSPDTCVLVDSNINSIFIKCNKSRGKYPIGVTVDKRYGSIYAQASINNKDGTYGNKYLGVFKTVEDAFNSYKSFKESYIKQVADEYKLKYPNFPQKLYDAMYSYEVEITD